VGLSVSGLDAHDPNEVDVELRKSPVVMTGVLSTVNLTDPDP